MGNKRVVLAESYDSSTGEYRVASVQKKALIKYLKKKEEQIAEPESESRKEKG